ncbi:unnamed protein product [Phaeothamnion confervicola]
MQTDTVLFTSNTLSPNVAFCGATNAAGRRLEARLGGHGGFTVGARVFAGGPPRDIKVMPDIAHGIVLHHSDMSKPAADSDMFMSGHGAFIHDELRAAGGALRGMPMAASWAEAGQAPGCRRGSQGHYHAGVTIIRGGQPMYTELTLSIQRSAEPVIEWPRRALGRAGVPVPVSVPAPIRLRITPGLGLVRGARQGRKKGWR